MSAHLLDNPIWSSLTTQQACFAEGRLYAKRYPPEVAPFAAVESASVRAADELAQIVAAGESIYLVGVAPEIDARWTLTLSDRIVQMVWKAGAVSTQSEGDIVDLKAVDATDMLALTLQVFPGYFRARTPEMGRYCGIRKAGILAAMAGERMRLTGFQEISAVCTHPHFAGRGYATRLVAHLVRSCLHQDWMPFLHVSESNERARTLYERLGFAERRSLPLWQLQRNADGE
ncbi:MAG: GNAT family N-acetyltransferase [Steroidobacteraceae bacterium]